MSLPLALGLLDSATDWAIVLLIVLLLFGGAKIPELARSLGKAKAEFRKGQQEGDGPTKVESAESDEAKTLRAARELGIPTEGRALSDVKADIRRKMA